MFSSDKDKQPEIIFSTLKEFGSKINAKRPRLKSLLDLIFEKNDQESPIQEPAPAATATEDQPSSQEEEVEHPEDPMEAKEPAGNSVSSTAESKHMQKKKRRENIKNKKEGSCKLTLFLCLLVCVREETWLTYLD